MLRAPTGRVLFLKRSGSARDHPGEWCCPGGSIEGGETPAEAARRETIEETGYAPGYAEPCDEHEGFATYQLNIGEEFKPVLSDEHDEYQWAAIDAPPQPLHPGVAHTLEKMMSNGAALDTEFKESDHERDAEGKFTLFHGTSESSFNSISKQGFKPAEGLVGTGVYFTSHKGEAASYGSGRHVLQARLKPGAKIKEFRSKQHFEETAGGGLYSEATAALQKRLQEEGYAGHSIVKSDTNLKGAQKFGDRKWTVVYDPASLEYEAASNDAALDRREYDTNGWFEVLDNPLSTVGVYQYSGKAIDANGSLGLDPNKMYGVFRPPEELGSEECVKSFRLMPWTDDHPSTMLGPKERGLTPAEEKGVHGVIGEKTYFNPADGTLYGNIKVFSEALAWKIAAGKRELSCGYRCDFIPQEGVYNGEPYQFVQRNMRGNHFSSVDKGRMGSGVRVLDAAERFTFALDMKEPTVAEKDDDKGGMDVDTLKFIKDNAAMCDKVRGMDEEEFKKMKAKADDAEEDEEAEDGEEEDPAGGKESPGKEGDLKPKKKGEGGSTDKKGKAKDSKKAKDEESEEEEEDEDAEDEEEDAEDEDEDEKDDKKGKVKDRKPARDRKGGGMDAAEIASLVVPAIRKEIAAKQKLYQRLSPIVGAFDHDEMTLRDMAAYGLKKLGASEARDPVSALDYYLAGRGQAAVQAQPRGPRDSARDSGESSFLDTYLQ